jgi:hypothetical protein
MSLLSTHQPQFDLTLWRTVNDLQRLGLGQLVRMKLMYEFLDQLRRLTAGDGKFAVG